MGNDDACAAARPVLAELAVGGLGGDERAEALRHVASCPDCAHELKGLAEVADALLLLAPPAEPPAGFETAALARMTGAPPNPRRRVLALAAGVIAVALAGAATGAAVVHHEGDADRLLADQYRRVLATADGQHLRALALSTDTGRGAGSVFLYQGRPSWMLVAIADAPANGAYRTVVTYTRGTNRDAGVCQVDDGTGATAYPLRAPAAEVATVTLTAPDGTILRTS
jgi:hypothetical protein